MTTEVIEGEATEVRQDPAPTPSRALTVATPPQTSVMVGGMVALARMSDEQFDENIKALETLRTRVDKVKRALMVKDVDYGPPFAGSKKDVLLKPGAETLLRTFGLADSYRIERHVGDGVETPELDIVVYCQIHVGDTAGPVIAEGMGSANTWEVKHRYRSGQAARTCPDCGKSTVIRLREKPKDDGTVTPARWWCGTREGGCGHSFPLESDKAKAIEKQDVGRQENEDPWDVANTILKMGAKRARVDGVLTATGTSGLFSQDEDAPGARQAATSASEAPGAAGRAAPPSTSGSTASSAPGGPPAPSGAISGVLEKVPDGLRHVRIDGVEHDKVELVFKVGNSRRTAIVLEPLAAQLDAYTAHLQPGDNVAVTGTLVEVEWQEGKPKKKEIHDVRSVTVKRDEGWVVIAGPVALVDPTPASAATTSGASVATTSPTSATTPSTTTTPPATSIGASTETVWAARPDGSTVNEVVVLLAVEKMTPEGREPFVRILARDSAGHQFRIAADMLTAEEDGLLDKFTPGEKVQLLGSYEKGERAIAWVAYTGMAPWGPPEDEDPPV